MHKIKTSMKTKKTLFFATAIGILLAVITVILGNQTASLFSGVIGLGGSNENTLVLSSSNPIVNAQVRTTKGTVIWAKGDADSGVTWNNGQNKVFISRGGYIQTNTIIHGINQISVDMVSGSLSLYKSWAEAIELMNPMYETGQTFNASGTYTFGDVLPNRIRLFANADTVINSITIRFDCESAEGDANLETINDGLENSYIDPGALLTYATTSYVTGEGNVSSNSKRALKLQFNNTANNFVSLHFEQNTASGLADNNPDFSRATLSLKAKFSNNISDYGLNVCPVGSTWTHPGYLPMNRSFDEVDGWHTFNFDFSHLQFNGNNSIIRLNIAATGINESNKSSAYILLDDISYDTHILKTRVVKETIDDGLENLEHDIGMENCYYGFNNQVTYGKKSKSSLEVRPGKSSYSGSYKWNVVLSPEGEDFGNGRYSLDLSEGLLTMQYKPINVQNPGTLYFGVLKSWSEHKIVQVNSQAINDGWYSFEYNLASLNLGAGSYIRFTFGFDAEDSNLNKCVVYYDNIKVIDPQEDYTLGWENMARDDDWGSSIATVDRLYKASDTSINSMKLTFANKSIDDRNKACMIISPQVAGISSGLNFNTGILEAKFLFSSEVQNKTVRLLFTDSNWKANRYNVEPEPIGNGWYHLQVDLSNLPSPVLKDADYNGQNIIRIGFGFCGVNDSNKNTATVWIDDVFYTNNNNISTITSATLWEAYDTENVMKTESVISGRNITTSNPLEFSGLKNETSSTQLMIKANTAISSYSLKMGTLYSENGNHIDAQDFKAYVEKYFTIDSLSAEKNGSSYGWRGAGSYPDALIPVDRIIKAGENTIESGKQQGIWIDLKINKNLKAGTYTGNAVLTLNNISYNIPVSTIVYDALMSDTYHSKNVSFVWDDMFETQWGEGTGSNTKLMKKAYYEKMLDYRLSPGSMTFYDRYDTYVEFAEHFANNIFFDERMTVYRIPTDGSYETLYGYFNALIDKNIEMWEEGYEVSLFDKIILYVNDEPAQPSDNTIPQAWQNVQTTQTNFHNALNALSGKLNDYPEIKASFLDIRNVLPINCDYANITGGSYKANIFTTKYYPNLFNDSYIDTPCPTFDHINVPSERESYFSTFDHVWFYGCIVPNLPYPSYHMDTTLLGQRMVKWMQHLYGVEGELYYCTNYYRRTDYSGYDYTERDPYSDPYSSGFGAGDGRLLYPGRQYNVLGPLPSMRLASFRNADQDYEYMYMIDQRIDKYNAIHGTNYTSSNQIIASYCSNMFSGTQIKKSFSSETFKTYRNALLAIVAELY